MRGFNNNESFLILSRFETLVQASLLREIVSLEVTQLGLQLVKHQLCLLGRLDRSVVPEAILRRFPLLGPLLCSSFLLERPSQQPEMLLKPYPPDSAE